MPTQLQRSVEKTSPDCAGRSSRTLCGREPKRMLRWTLKLHQALSRGVLQILAETYLGSEFDDAAIMNAPCLEIFQDADKELGTERTRSLSSFVQENHDKIAPEDLGGISELLSGHSLKLKSDLVAFENNPHGAGRIYTPYDVTEHMCQESIIEMMKGMSSPQEVVSMRILDPAVGSGAFLAQAYRSILNQSLVQGSSRRQPQILAYQRCASRC